MPAFGSLANLMGVSVVSASDSLESKESVRGDGAQ
jgi:hypothetical protein